jgi:radical SAM protein with 4Fe4S-binding SPASM domain
MLLTKPVIKNILADKDEYFKYLYNEGFYIYFDYYTPGTDAMLVGPSDKELLQMFYFLVDNYPKVSPIREWIQNHTNVMSCRSSKLLLPDGTKCMCGNLTVEENKVVTFFKSKIQRVHNGEVEDSLLNRWDCLSCEYFNRCTLGCFMQHDFMKRGQMKECPFKLTFDKITKGKEVNIDSLEQYFGTEDAGEPESRKPAHC